MALEIARIGWRFQLSGKKYHGHDTRAVFLGRRTNRYAKTEIIVFGFASFLWLLLRTGTKPSRISYPCQQAALANSLAVFPALTALILGLVTGTSRLINLMAQNGLDFYSRIKPDDVVLIKINEEWPERGGTDTDILKQLIQAIVAHPQGFVGEIVVADNGQFQGSMNWAQNNAEDPAQSTQNVVDMFKPEYRVSTYDWMPIRKVQVVEYSNGNYANGFVVNITANTETGIKVSYPKFQSAYGTYIGIKEGIWNGTGYEEKLKVINVPVLKSHWLYGVTASLKNYMGVQSEGEAAGEGGLANGHNSVAKGGMGTLMAETRIPALNIVCAIWVNAVPQDGPQTPYSHATRTNIIAASTDPAALDYWASKYILVPAAKAIGYSDTHTLDPDSTERTNVGKEALGIWLPKTRDALIRAGYGAPTNPQQMNVHVLDASSNLAPTTLHDYNGLWHNSDFAINLAASASNGVSETYYRINNGPVQNVELNGHPFISTSNRNNTLEYWCVDGRGWS